MFSKYIYVVFSRTAQLEVELLCSQLACQHQQWQCSDGCGRMLQSDFLQSARIIMYDVVRVVNAVHFSAHLNVPIMTASLSRSYCTLQNTDASQHSHCALENFVQHCCLAQDLQTHQKVAPTIFKSRSSVFPICTDPYMLFHDLAGATAHCAGMSSEIWKRQGLLQRPMCRSGTCLRRLSS